MFRFYLTSVLLANGTSLVSFIVVWRHYWLEWYKKYAGRLNETYNIDILQHPTYKYFRHALGESFFIQSHLSVNKNTSSCIHHVNCISISSDKSILLIHKLFFITLTSWYIWDVVKLNIKQINTWKKSTIMCVRNSLLTRNQIQIYLISYTLMACARLQ